MEDAMGPGERADEDGQWSARDGLHVLIVDDDPGARALVRAVFDHVSVERVDEATDGLRALEAAREHSYDLVVMDHNMPGLDGVAATRELLVIHPTVRVVGFSGAHEEEICRAFREAGAIECFRKDQLAALHGFASRLAA